MKDFFRMFFNQADGGDVEIVPIDYEKAVRKAITVGGRVQGVGFRMFTQQTARKLGLTGWVKNLNNGDVTMEVQGAPETIDELIARLKRGNKFSKVTRMEVQDLDVDKEEKSFAITY